MRSESPSSHRQGSVRLALTLIVILGTALALYQLESDSLWLDEITTVEISTGNLLAIVESLKHQHAAPPLYYFILHPFTRLSTSEFMVRLPSVFFGLLALSACFCVARLLFGKATALLATFLLAISPLHLQYAQEARMYTLFEALALLSLYFFVKAIRTGQRRFWVGYTLATVLSIYTHYFTVFYVIVQSLFLVMITISRWIAARREKPVTEIGKGIWLGFVLSLLSLLVLYLPWLSFALARSQGTGLRQGFASVLTLALRGLVGDPTTALPYVLGGLFLWGLIVCWLTKQAEHGVLLGLWVLLPLPLIYLFLSRAQSFFAQRYIIFILPVLLIVVSRGVTGLGELLTQLTKPRFQVGQHQVYGLLGAAFLIFSALSVGPLKDYYALETEDWRGAASYLQSHAQPGSLMICDGILYKQGGDAYRSFRGLRYYLGSSFEDYEVVEETQVTQAVEPIVQEDREVWGIVWGNLGSWKPDKEEISVVQFPQVSVIRVRNESATVLDRSIILLELFLEFLRGQARSDIHLELFQLYTIRGDMDRARVHLDQALIVPAKDSNPDSALWATWQKVGDLFFEAGQWEEAIIAYQRAVQLQPNQAGLFFRLCRTYHRLGEGYEAETFGVCQQAVALDESHAWYRVLLGDAYVKNGYFDQALAEYGEALHLEPSYEDKAWYHWRLGNAYRLAGKTASAIAAYERVLALDRDNAEAARWLKELQQ